LEVRGYSTTQTRWSIRRQWESICAADGHPLAGFGHRDVELNRKQSLRGIEKKIPGQRLCNTVISQCPTAGQLLDPGGTVTLDAHAAPPKVTVPNVIKKPAPQAIGELSK